jgi:hypothetical protein
VHGFLQCAGNFLTFPELATTWIPAILQKEEVVAQLVKRKVVARIMDYLRGDMSAHARLLVMLLANVTTNDSACLDLLQLDTKALAGLNVYVLQTDWRLPHSCAVCHPQVWEWMCMCLSEHCHCFC